MIKFFFLLVMVITLFFFENNAFGQNEYSEGMIDAEMESALNGVGKIRLNHVATTKAIIYEALTTHQIAGG